MINITFPDGNKKAYPANSTPFEIAKSISEGLARNILTAHFNGLKIGLTEEINSDGTIQFFTWDSPEGKEAFWHSSAHVLAQSLEEIYPGIKLTIGPAIESGFYYDVESPTPINEADFGKIETTFLKNAKKDAAFSMRNISKNEALSFYKNNPFKTELIENLTDGEITFCDHDNFTDLCRGGHIPSTGKIKAIKIMNVAGAYWRGDEKNPQLTRVYGVSFPKKKLLTEHLELLEEAKKRDHRKLGKELELFTFSQKVGSGLPLWLPKGAMLRNRLEDFLKKAQIKSGYEPVITPHIGHKELYVTSGHYEKYGEDSFQPIKTPHMNEEFLLKPMNCPHHCEIYKSSPRSYKDLPIRYAEFGTVYRYEQSGELHGLTRVRCFTQDDAHLFCSADQVKEEFKNVIDLVLYVFHALGFNDFVAQISLRDKDDHSKYIGSNENWEKAEQAIVEATKEKGLATIIEYGEAAFYGPKLDFMVKDALGRSWQLGTIQVDYNLPERFELTYKGADNELHRPVMIHRAPFGSLERFVAVLIENCAGNFPLWLTPDQIAILPVSEKYNQYAKNVLTLLEEEGVRGIIDDRNEKMGRKIRDNEMKKIPYLLIIGEKEVANNSISVRQHGGNDLGEMQQKDFIQYINNEVNNYFKNLGGPNNS